jgi:hypothetical protein
LTAEGAALCGAGVMDGRDASRDVETCISVWWGQLVGVDRTREGRRAVGRLGLTVRCWHSYCGTAPLLVSFSLDYAKVFRGIYRTALLFICVFCPDAISGG